MKIQKGMFYAATLLFLFAGTLSGQITSIQLNTTEDSASSFRVLNNIGTTRLLLNSDGGFCLTGDYSHGVIPKTGGGTRLMWHPAKVAFRAGHVNGTQWDEDNIGSYSVALGSSTRASGNGSFAAGASSIASGNFSTATGYSTTAEGSYSLAIGNGSAAIGTNSVAIGMQNIAVGDYSVAFGWNSVTSGTYSTVMGYSNQANGHSSTAMGYLTIANGTHSLATGNTTVAEGEYTTAMGNFVKANHEGSFIMGDRSKVTSDSSSAIHQMTMRFAGGYRLFTNSACTTGVTLAAGGSSWASVSDSTRKTNFVKSNGEEFLNNLSRLRLGSWNYKGQDPASFRHYGPMAQEIFSYFGKDEYGTIGNETTLAGADMDGIMMICLQALEKRTKELQLAYEKIQIMERENIKQKSINTDLIERLEKLERVLASEEINKKDIDKITLNK